MKKQDLYSSAHERTHPPRTASTLSRFVEANWNSSCLDLLDLCKVSKAFQETKKENSVNIPLVLMKEGLWDVLIVKNFLKCTSLFLLFYMLYPACKVWVFFDFYLDVSKLFSIWIEAFWRNQTVEQKTAHTCEGTDHLWLHEQLLLNSEELQVQRLQDLHFWWNFTQVFSQTETPPDFTIRDFAVTNYLDSFTLFSLCVPLYCK